MSHLVGPFQSSFVLNCQSGDNIIMAQEIFHSMRKKGEKKGQRLDGYDYLEKSCVYFSNNICQDQRKHLSEELGIQFTKDLGKYLGVPIFHKRTSINTFQFILDKVHQRFSAWKARTLSF